MIWAPIIFIAAEKIAAPGKSAAYARPLAGVIWPAALILAALPVLIAPVAAALGFSLRAPAQLPPMAEIAAPAAMPAPNPDLTSYDRAPAGASLADILRAATVIYFYGFVMLFTLAAARHIWFIYRLNFAIPADEPKLIEKLESWRQRIGVNQRTRYAFSHIVSSVCVYGFFRPVVIMPINLLERVSIEEAALMGAHEMAHVKRGDVILFALCSLVKAVFWFNPFMHRICARATLAAEQGADALVLARGVDRRQYAKCFVQGLRFAAGAQRSIAGELIPSFTPFDKRSRRERLDAILMGMPEKQFLPLTAKLGLAAGASLAAGLAVAQAAFTVAPPAPRDALPVAPVEGEITLDFRAKSMALGSDRPEHEGVDIKAKRGLPVRAAGAGKVIDATDRYQGSKAWGKVVVIDHGHGLVTRYAHLDSYIVRKGDKVAAGDVIGAVGSSGKATGPHLHFEVISDGEAIDPAPVVAPRAQTPPLPPAAKTKTTRTLAFPPIVGASDAPNVNGKTEFKEKKSTRVAKEIAALEERLRKKFEKFDAFDELDSVSIRINDIAIDRLDEAQMWLDKLEDEIAQAGDGEIEVIIREAPKMFAYSYFSEADKKDIEQQREEAIRHATEAMAKAREKVAHINEEVLARELSRAKSEVNRALREEEILAHREKAVRSAKESLERELAEIERRRAELKKQNNASEER